MKPAGIILSAALWLPVCPAGAQTPEYYEVRAAASFGELSELRPSAPGSRSVQNRTGQYNSSLIPLSGVERSDTIQRSDETGARLNIQPAVPAPAGRAPAGDKIRRDYQAILLKSPNRYDALTRAQLRTLYLDSYNNKVASFDKLPYYDPSEQLGFCFGRAIASHLLARKMGLKEASTGKVFMVGELKENGVTLWRFHVSAMVKGPGGDWYAIDSNLQGPATLRAWIKETRSFWDPDAKARVYVTHAPSVFPDIRVFPAPGGEKGENLIELSFEPAGKIGFTAWGKDFEPLVYSVDENAARRYFIDTDEDSAEDRFDFLGITVAGERYDYRNYFADLVADIGGPERGAGNIATAAPAGRRLFSPRWGTR